MSYIKPLYQINFFPNDKNVHLEYRISPNLGCEIVDIASKITGKGAGTIVYTSFEKWVKDTHNIKNMYAFTRHSNVKAHNWYIKMGFTSTIIPNFYYDEKNFQAYLLTKNLF
mgnify:CR=1 FL=1|tara:strand:- start:175 stop:510 length:336 start_codon:yes stop_codon:yes gene_type:complete